MATINVKRGDTISFKSTQPIPLPAGTWAVACQLVDRQGIRTDAISKLDPAVSPSTGRVLRVYVSAAITKGLRVGKYRADVQFTDSAALDPLGASDPFVISTDDLVFNITTDRTTNV